MGNEDFGWESLLHTDAPEGCTLNSGLFTTYDRADTRLVVEHLLPTLLRLGHEPADEGTEKEYFLLELDGRLKQLHDKLVVVSSRMRDEDSGEEKVESGEYAWIWKSVRHLTVGADDRAVQHAKLWMLHWRATDNLGTEYLELVVSSANLTMSAFKSQLQAGWRACIKLQDRGTRARRKSWGILPDFLERLALSTRKEASLEPFLALLSRAACPDNVTFVASVPGVHSRRALRKIPWATAGLRRLMPGGRGKVTASILSPYVGSWRPEYLKRWCAAFEGTIDSLKLVWIDSDHPWARDGHWVLPKNTLKTLVDGEALVLHLRHSPDDEGCSDHFHAEHRHADSRWSHAKVYFFQRGKARRLLITSANFSSAAWGTEEPDGSLAIENFELGVCIDQATWPLAGLHPVDDDVQLATVSKTFTRRTSLINWADAEWDGKTIALSCRYQAGHVLHALIKCGNKSVQVKKWKASIDGSGCKSQVRWTDAKCPPSELILTCGEETMTVSVFDKRPPQERDDDFPPGVDEDRVEAMRDKLLFEQFGGRVAGEGEGDGDGDGDGITTDGATDSGEDDLNPKEHTPPSIESDALAVARHDDYTVPEYVDARYYLGIVDNWAAKAGALMDGKNHDQERQQLRRDGQRLGKAMQRQAGRDALKSASRAIGAALAAEEMALRLKHFPEK